MNPLLLLPAIEEEVVRHPDLGIAKPTEETTYAIARWLMNIVEWFLKFIGMPHEPHLFTILYAVLVFLVAVVVGMALKWVVVFVLDRLVSPHVKSDLYAYLVSQNFFSRLCRIVPALLFLILLQFTLTGRQSLASWLSRLSWIYITYVLARSLATLADSIWNHINRRENKKKLPLNGIVQLIKMVIYILCVIVIIGILVNKSPGSLLAGLGAFAAVLMLVFKDSILGVVAGVQLAENDSLHVGDWIAVPGTDANGTVVEVGLTAVKIENWDKTISTVPPYNLISNGFKNYRFMQASNTRRIQRSYMIDADSVVPTDDGMLASYAQIPLLKDWIEKKIAQRQAGKEENVKNSEGLADGSIDTNLGVFRAYLKIWLDVNPNIDKGSDCFVCTLAQTASGIPLQLYCFTSTSAWIPYEGIQSSVFEHVAAMLYKFNLYTYENASGRDTLLEGYMGMGKTPEPIVGIPYPFFNNSGTPEKPGTPPEGLYK